MRVWLLLLYYFIRDGDSAEGLEIAIQTAGKDKRQRDTKRQLL